MQEFQVALGVFEGLFWVHQDPRSVPVNMTKTELADQLAKTTAELEDARELLAAIALAADVPISAKGGLTDVRWALAAQQRLSAIKVHAASQRSFRIGAACLIDAEARPLGFEPYGGE